MKGLCPDCGKQMRKVDVVRTWGSGGKVKDIERNLWYCSTCDVVWAGEFRDPETFRERE